MSDTFITIVAVMIATVLLFAVPMMTAATQNDVLTQTTVDTMVADFVHTAAVEGKITKNNYDDFIQKLYSTGNSYDVSIEIQKMDKNIITKNGDTIGENAYYSVFRNDLDSAFEENEEYFLKQGDRIIVKVENTNVTFGTQFKNYIFSLMGKDTIAIESSSSSLVTAMAKTGQGLPVEIATEYLTITYHSNLVDSVNVQSVTPDHSISCEKYTTHTIEARPQVSYLTDVRYSFKGWTENPNGTGTLYHPGDTLTVSSNIDLYAKWTKVEPQVNENVTITYYANFESNNSIAELVSPAIDIKQCVKGENHTIIQSPQFNLTDGNYEINFLGWSTRQFEIGIEGLLQPGESMYNVTRDIILYAQWETIYNGDDNNDDDNNDDDYEYAYGINYINQDMVTWAEEAGIWAYPRGDSPEREEWYHLPVRIFWS